MASIDRRTQRRGVRRATDEQEAPSPRTDVARAFGNTVTQSALAGASEGGLGPVLRDAALAEIAGVRTASVGDGDVPNSEMQAVYRSAQSGGNAAFTRPSGGGSGLASPVRARMEAAFGHDFGHVRIHTDGAAARASADLQAHAFAMGADIWFGQGEYAPGTREGDRLLAHELTHVVQHDEGRLGGGSGVSSPTDPSEREAYATEARIASALPAIDRASGAATPPAASTSSYGGRPSTSAISRSADLSSAGVSRDGETAPEGGRRGPTTTEDALMGPMPSVTQAPRTATPAAPTPPAAPSAEVSATAPVAAAPTSAGPEGPEAVSAPTVSAIGGGPGTAPNVPAVTTAVPTLTDPAGWAERARQEGTTRADAIRAAAEAASGRIRAAAERATTDARARFAEVRARLTAAAEGARAAIGASVASAGATVEAGLGAAGSEVDTAFTTRIDAARTATEAARTRYTSEIEVEANRAITESAARAERARALASQTGGGGDAPLATGQADIARRVSEEVATQCLQTGQDAAAEVRKAGAARSEGFDGYTDDFVEALDDARTTVHEALETTRTEALEALASEAERMTGEVDARLAEATGGLDGQEEQLVAWIATEAERAGAEIGTRSEGWATEVSGGFEQLATSFDAAAADVDAAFAEVADPDPASIAEAREAVSAELAVLWQNHATPLETEGGRLAGLFDQQATELEGGVGRAVDGAASTLSTGATEAEAGLRQIGERYTDFAAQAAERASGAARDGVAAALAEADRAQQTHQAAIDGDVEQALGALRGAVDQQLAWEDGQVAKAAEEIGAGQARAASEYATAKAEAEQRDAGASTATISRGWLGDLWDWFGDMAEGTLEWFQEKLGRTWGNIIGHVLRVLIYAVGVVACGLAWVGAQLVNLVWGFIWGETAIPGYGGGVVAFIGDLIAGILIIGDVRDLIKYLIVRPLMGEGPWWFNLLMAGIAIIGVIPLFGDGLKSIVKALIKGGVKAAMKRLVKELGQELAERLVREVGEEAAEELLEKLGKEALIHLSGDLAAPAIRQLVEELGERTLKRLATELGGEAIQRLSSDLGKEAVEKLLRTVGGETAAELNERLGKDAVLKLLEGLRGVTIKEYADALGHDVLRKLAQEIDGYAVKSLVDDLGADVLKKLAGELGGTAIQRITTELGPDLVTKLASELGGTAIERLTTDLGADALKKLAEELGGTAIQHLATDLGADVVKKLAADLGGNAIQQLATDLGADVVKRLAADLSGTVIQRLAAELGGTTLKALGEKLSGTTISELFDTLGKDVLIRFNGSLGADGLKQITDAIPVARFKQFVDDLGEVAIEQFGAKALAEVGPHLAPNELMELLTNPNGPGIAFARQLCEEAGSAAALRSAAGHFGSFAALAEVLGKAATHGAPAAGLKDFLTACSRNGWKKLVEIENFFRYAATSGASWTDLVRWCETLAANTARNTTKVGGRTAADAAAPYFKNLVDSAGNAVRITFNAADAAHVASRHTWERFAVTPGNADLANSMLPAAIKEADVEAIGARLLQDPAIDALVRGLAPNTSGLTQIADGAITYEVRVTLQGGINGMTTFYPVAGAGVETLSKDAMRAIIWLFQSI